MTIVDELSPRRSFIYGQSHAGRCHTSTIVVTLIILALFYFAVQESLSDSDDFVGSELPFKGRSKFSVEQYGVAHLWRARMEVSLIDCKFFFLPHNNNTERVPLSPIPLEMHCNAIRSRVLPFRSYDTGFPIAYSKTVYTDYELIEEQLTISFALENSFCFVLDSKSDDLFKRRMKRLSECLPNVIIAGDLEMDRYGHNQNKAHLLCLEKLLQWKWNYAILLQNHDVMLKAHWEIGKILSLFNGTSDIEVTKCSRKRCEPFLEKDIDTLNLCPIHMSCEGEELQWAKGAQQCSLSRDAVTFLLNEIDLTPLTRQLNFLDEGADEVLFPTLAVSNIGLPGGYTSQCLPKRNRFITRYSNWEDDRNKCLSGLLRHYICVLGVNDLFRLSRIPHFSANKMIPSYDYAAVHCISQLVFNRSRHITQSALNVQYYTRLNNVRYNMLKNQINDSAFIC